MVEWGSSPNPQNSTVCKSWLCLTHPPSSSHQRGGRWPVPAAACLHPACLRFTVGIQNMVTWFFIMKQIFYVLLCVRQQGAVCTWFSYSSLNSVGKNWANSDSKKKRKKERKRLCLLLGCVSTFFSPTLASIPPSQGPWGSEDNEITAPITFWFGVCWRLNEMCSRYITLSTTYAAPDLELASKAWFTCSRKPAIIEQLCDPGWPGKSQL